jgi:cytochrome b561
MVEKEHAAEKKAETSEKLEKSGKQEKPERPKLSDEAEAKLSRVSMLVHTIVGIGAGWLSNLMGGTLSGVGVLIISLVILKIGTDKATGKGAKWWLANGGAVFIFVWLIAWIFFFNMK